jgi:predicted transposase YbfD/YdcC
MENPLRHFAELRDPRVERNREHLLDEILLIAIAAVLSGAESWNDIVEYGANKLEWLHTFLTLPSGIPSHDTFKRAGHAAQNFSVLNRIALNLHKQDKSSKRGIKGKRHKAAWNHPYLLKLPGI